MPGAGQKPWPRLIAQFPAGQLDKYVFQIRRPVHVAQTVGVSQFGQQVARFATIKESRFAAGFNPLGQPAMVCHEGWQIATGFIEDLDHLRFDMLGDQLPWATFGNFAAVIDDDQAIA